MELIKQQIEGFTALTSRVELVDLNLEAIVPDTMADIIRVVGAYGGGSLREKSVEQDRVIISGQVGVQVLCITGDQGVCQLLPITLPLSHIISVPSCKEGSRIIVEVEVAYCTATIINSRKILVKAQAKIALRVYEEQPRAMTCGIESRKNLHTLYTPFKTQYIGGICEKTIRIIENIPIASEGLCVVRTNVRFITEDVRVLRGKIMLKGNALVEVLYMNVESGNVSREKYHLPYSCIIEGDCIAETDKIEVKYQTKNIEIDPRESTSGSSLACDISCDIGILCHREVEVPVLTDIYSSLCEAQVEWSNITGVVGGEPQSIQVDVSFDVPTQTQAVDICDYSYSISSRYTENGRVYATISMQIMYRDNSGDIYCTAYRHEAEAEVGGKVHEVEVLVENIKISPLEKGYIGVECDCVFGITYCTGASTRQVTTCVLLEDTLKTRQTNASLILRNVGEGDSIWSIAKKYNTSPETIMAANKLSGSDIECGRLIMIPIVK